MPVAKGGGPSNNAEDGPTVVIVNGVWIDERFPLRPSYEELIRGVHKCEAKTVDFLHEVSEVENEINSWANVVSRGLIKEILQPGSLNPDTAIVLANGLYFKGLWDGDYKFSHTEKRDFYLSNGNIVFVPFMTSDEEYYFGSFDGFKVPKFKFSFDFDVSEVMEDMGEPLTFLENPKDWSDMMHIPEDVPFMTTKMIQKACIEVDEKGTEAAAVTVLMMAPGAAMHVPPPETASFVADHPFMFMIKEETSVLLYIWYCAVSNSKRKKQIKVKITRMEFCTRLANQLMLKKVEEHEEKNSVVSPVSINAVLNMVAAGSNGATLDHFFVLLGSKTVKEINSESSKMMAVAADVRLDSANNGAEDNDGISPVLAMVNGAWFDQRFPLKPSYGEGILKGIFNCEAKTADQVREEINAWAEAASRGLIKDFLEPNSPSSEAALVLINGLYFKGNWNCDYKFDSELTKNRDFYLMNGDIVSVPFMTSCACYPCQSFYGFKVLSIPYESGQLSSRDFSMYFFLPDERDGLQNLLKKLMILKPRKYFNLCHNELDQFLIPKFKFSYGFDVLKSMRDMGTPSSFLTNPKDLSEMMHVPEDVNDFVPNMIQKAFIEIDEKGTEAAAITEFSDEMGCSLQEPERMSFVADHPFVFMIREATSGLVFFTGAVLDPSQRN
ncbi:hypothetical protein RHGRI_019838 [Rhododendron griersonianum]|uniref:Serpin domain-containing protein n=1 Tax=Rhododendron griersonianum TaxID=479676 RepID=A0AAV6JJF7_9ERIC|nr:hypothetical protein RHGRI_019838 [Rhododendron griersonianum]